MRAGLIAIALLATPAGAVQFRQPAIGDVTVTAYYDIGGTRDWNCGNNTYGGHRGTDIAIIGRFAAQDQGRDIVAAAPGRVIRAHDGEFDRCTSGSCGGGGGFGNYVALEHADGKVTYYGHMRQGSVAVREGDNVSCGQRLGQVGSSGNSTGPHVHFEVRVNGAADDPFTGPCGGPLTYWVDQGPYRGLPVSRCEEAEPPPPPPAPDFHLSQGWRLPDRPCDFDDCRDFIRDGRSGGVPDAWVGEEITWQIVAQNRGGGRTQAETPEDAAVILEYSLPPGVTPVRYLIETDHPAYDQASWQRNDAMDNAANPPEDAPPAAGQLRLNGFSPGEAKRVSLVVRVDGRSIDAPGRPEARAWMRHVRGYYGEKTSWDDPVEVNDRQGFNGGDLRVAGPLDTFDPRAFLFDAPEDDQQIEGFRSCAPDAVGGLLVNREEGALAIEVTGAGPCVESPRLQVPLDGLAGVRLRARQHQAPRDGYLWWTTDDAPDFGDDRRVAFATTGGGAFNDLHLGPGWSGTLTRLRLTPVPDAGDGSPWFDVAELRLVPDAPPPAPDPDAGPPPPPGSEPRGPDGPDPGDAGADLPETGAPPPRRDAGDPAAATGTTLTGDCRAQPGQGGAAWLLGLLLLARSRHRRRHPR